MATLKVEQKSIKDLFQGTKGGFLIPDYQRPYEWEEVECKTLWEDLFSFAFPNENRDAFRIEEEYFLGPIVTFNNDGKMEVIDGQQRLTTLMLLLRAFYNRLGNMQDPRSKKMREVIEECIWCTNIFGEFDKNSLKINSQIATDDDKEDLISILREGHCEGKKSLYARNFKYFVDMITEFLGKYPTYFTDFPARLLNNCVLLPIEADSQDTALRIFSTLNDRGKPLADADIFKAQFYKYYSSKGIEQKNEFMKIWKELDKITGDIFNPIYGTPLDDLFTLYMYYERAQSGIKSSTVEGLRKFYEGGGNYPLLQNEKTLYNLMSLAKFWQDVTNQEKERFSERVLRKLFVLNYAPNGMWRNITSVYFLHNRDEKGDLEDEPFYKFLDRIIAFIWAYTITNPGINSLRTPIFAEMVKIVNNIEVDFSEFKISEEKYRANVTNYVFSNSRAITKAMLTWWAFSVEEQKLIRLTSRFDIEHIYPRNRYENEHGLQKEQSMELLGNKSLLEKNINISASDYRFVDKKKYYLGFETSKGIKKMGTEIAELSNLATTYSDFTESQIISRNEKIINSFVEYLKENNLLED